mgnify:CR=1 FL=1
MPGFALPLLLALALALPGGAAADRRMLAAEEAPTYSGVGRLNVAGTRFCTATLIAPDLALTAAHCLYHPRSKRRVPLGEFRFVAGLRLGAYAAVRRVRRAAVAEDYIYSGDATMRTVRRDLALLELDAPVAAADAGVFAIGPPLRDHAPVALVSYARDRAHAPSIEDVCGVKAAIGLVAALDCDVTYGASGAPVFVEDAAGARKIAAVVSAMGRGPGRRPVALAVMVEPTLGALRERLEAWPVRRPRGAPGRAPAPPPRPAHRTALATDPS